MRAFALKLFRDETGATAIEYALMASLIAMVIIGAVTALGTTISAKYNNINNGLP